MSRFKRLSAIAILLALVFGLVGTSWGLTANEAITRFKANEERIDQFTNYTGTYTSSGGTDVETLMSFIARKDAEVSARYILNVKGDWGTSTAYVINDLVLESGTVYICIEAHTSGVFATDLAAGKWLWYQGLSLDGLYFANSLATLTAANSNANVNEIVLTEDVTLTGSLSISKRFRVSRNAVIDIPTGITLTVTAWVDPGPNIQTFNCSGTGTVVFADGSTDIVRPDYFGAVNDGDATTDDGPEMLLAINSAPKGATIKFTDGDGYYDAATTLYLDTSVNHTKHLKLEGPTKIFYGGSAKCISLYPSDATSADPTGTQSKQQHVIERLDVRTTAGNETTGAAQGGIFISGTTHVVLDNTDITGFSKNLWLKSDSSGWTEHLKIFHGSAGAGTYNIYFDPGTETTPQSFGDIDIDQFKITGVPANGYGVYLPRYCSIYRGKMFMTIFPASANSVGFYADGKMGTVTGSIHMEADSSKNGIYTNVGFSFGPNFNGQNSFLVNNFVDVYTRYSIDPGFTGTPPTGWYETTPVGLTAIVWPGYRTWVGGFSDSDRGASFEISTLTSSGANTIIETTSPHGITASDEIEFRKLGQDCWVDLNGQSFQAEYVSATSLTVPWDSSGCAAFVGGSNPDAAIALGSNRVKYSVGPTGLSSMFVRDKFSFYRMRSNFEGVPVETVPVFSPGSSTDSDTSPDVGSIGFLRLVNTASTTITRFDMSWGDAQEPYNGRVMYLLHVNGYTKLQNANSNPTPFTGPNIHLMDGNDYQGVTGIVQQFVYSTITHLWYEAGRSSISGSSSPASLFGLTSLSNYGSSLSQAVTDIGSDLASVVVDADTTISSDLELPDNILLSVMNHAIITVNTGITLTINSMADPGLVQVFNCVGTGKVVFNVGAVSRVPIQWFDDTPTSADFQQAIYAVEVSKIPIYVPTGTYTYNTAVSTTYPITVIGDGPQKSIFDCTDAVDMLSIFNPAAIVNGVRIEGVYFKGNHLATSGISLSYAYYSHMENVRIYGVVGAGLELHGVCDSTFRNVLVMHCGKWVSSRTNGTPSLLIDTVLPDASVYASNSLRFDGECIIERGYYHGVSISQAEEVTFLGTKFHGRTYEDFEDATAGEIVNDALHGVTSGTGTVPYPTDLVQVLGGQRIKFEAGQFAHAEQNAIFVNTESAKIPDVTITGNVFKEVHCYTPTTGAATFVYVTTGTGVIAANNFYESASSGLTTDAHESWTLRGSSIRLAAGAGNVKVPPGSNYYPANGWKTFYDLRTAHTQSDWLYQYADATGSSLFRQYVAEVLRFAIFGDGMMRWYDASGTAHVELTIPGLDEIRLAAGDKFSMYRMRLIALSAAPSDPTAGDLVLANRTAWDPLSKGSGNPYLVLYDGAAWVAP